MDISGIPCRDCSCSILPAGLVALFLFHRLAKGPLIGCLPAPFAGAASGMPAACRAQSFSKFALVCVSMIVGSATHLVWDSLTHSTYWLGQPLGVSEGTRAGATVWSQRLGFGLFNTQLCVRDRRDSGVVHSTGIGIHRRIILRRQRPVSRGIAWWWAVHLWLRFWSGCYARRSSGCPRSSWMPEISDGYIDYRDHGILRGDTRLRVSSQSAVTCTRKQHKTLIEALSV